MAFVEQLNKYPEEAALQLNAFFPPLRYGYRNRYMHNRGPLTFLSTLQVGQERTLETCFPQ